MAPAVGFEPTTNRLTADCSTAELSRNIFGGRYRNRTDIEGFAVLCITTLPTGLTVERFSDFYIYKNFLSRQ